MKNPGAVLTERQVIAARARYRAGERTTLLADEYGVTACTMRNALTGKSWGHLPGAVKLDPARSKYVHLDPDSVRLARIMYYRERKTYGEIAALFGVSITAAFNAVNKYSWRHVT